MMGLLINSIGANHSTVTVAMCEEEQHEKRTLQRAVLQAPLLPQLNDAKLRVQI